MIDFIQEYLRAQGRHGDSELRPVGGQLSHVNPQEANMIDNLGPLGQAMTQEQGAGTINPQTGMPEYYEWQSGDSWQEFKDISPTDFVNMEDKKDIADDLGDTEMTDEEWGKYMPSYDQELHDMLQEQSTGRQAAAEADSLYKRGVMREITGAGMRDLGTRGQQQLSQQNVQQANIKAKRNFEQTGNPMVDKQRQDIMRGVAQGTSDLWKKLTHDLHSEKTALENFKRGDQDSLDLRLRGMAKDYMQEFGDMIITFDDKVAAEKAAKDAGKKGLTWWDRSLGKKGIGGAVGTFWDRHIGKHGIVGGIGDAVGKAAKWVKGLFSDERLKENIKFEYTDNVGMPVYSYNYTFDDKKKRQYGYMAQDVEKIVPSAVTTENGFKKVDYSQLINRANKLVGKTKRLGE